MKNYITIPRSLILNKELGNKRVAAYAAILFSGWTGSSINTLVSSAGYSPTRGKSKISAQFKSLVDEFISLGYFSYIDGAIVYIKPGESYAIIYRSEFQRIILAREQSLSSGGRMNHAHILLLLAHIRLYMNNRDGVPRMYSNLLSRISESTGLSSRSISAGLKILEELNITHSEELPRYTDNNGCWHSNVTVFVDMEFRGQSEVDWHSESQKATTYILNRQTETRRNKAI